MRQLMETRVQKLLEHNDAQDIHLTEREEEFLNDIAEKCGDPETKLSSRQEEWVTAIHEKYLGGKIYG